MVKNNQGKIFQLGILLGVVLFVLGAVESWLSGGLYAVSDPALWSDMTGHWWLWALISDMVIGLILSLVYTLFYNAIPDHGVGKGIQYAFWIWLVGTVPGLIMTFLTMAVPTELVVAWLISGLLNYIIAGIILGLMYRPQQA
ncbi:MAG: putative membrane protein [Parcubacteria group bacterium GW2011_GWA2_43_17]|nr:MAG: putative membrane protein [Parcubacteria group bacterium GW2011_GWA2_43_17]KKT91986.1 MAG: putative membrane protein [Parcubacteria group bacterium GW2011_GWF2_45_11]KKT96585.1 MAG: putative membrane protein [Parcubacteria group bacterium GW2011_GWC2_45_15]OGY94324.1 MAG: hypothetical protein A3J95_00960 [Candidatus Komeilibacteria bacterium RIFOXYC2_FULL_45_12]HAH04880.1 hypothetical protein [Candidatus Komeilibacteria bacterium]